jgi:hypothetical protein
MNDQSCSHPDDPVSEIIISTEDGWMGCTDYVIIITESKEEIYFVEYS